MEEINKIFNEDKENKQKAIQQEKQTVLTVQDLKTEIEIIKKTQTEGILEMKNLGK